MSRVSFTIIAGTVSACVGVAAFAGHPDQAAQGSQTIDPSALTQQEQDAQVSIQQQECETLKDQDQAQYEGVVPTTYPDMPEVQTQNGIDYVTGGIGKEQSEAMNVAGQDYDLMLTFATDGGKYLADIDVQIEDMNGNTLLHTVSEGPLFLADLPVGRYKITAAAQGASHARIVDIGGERPTKAVFHWAGYAMD